MRTWKKENLIEAVKSSKSYAEVLRKLNLKAAGGNYIQIKKYISEYNLDITHFSGQGWSKGINRNTKAVDLKEKLVDGKFVNSNRLRLQLISSGIFEAICSNCNNNKWLGSNIPLELDHINGKREDNRIENLRLLCPNCHALTPTYRGKNKSRDVVKSVNTEVLKTSV